MLTIGSASGLAAQAAFFVTFTTAFCGPQPISLQPDLFVRGQTELVVVVVAVDVTGAMACIGHVLTGASEALTQ